MERLLASRAVLDLDADRSGAPVRDAATVAVVREGDAGPELFCVVRHRKSGFLGGAAVFPGGKVDATDAEAGWPAHSTGLTLRASQVAPTPREALSFAIAALRELFEEGAILPTAPASLDPTRLRDLRDEWTRSKDSLTFLAFLASHHLVIDTGSLEALSRWVTPTAEARRYDTRFYVLAAPPGQTGEHDAHETTSSFWARPEAILQRWERGEIMLAPPTSRTVELLRPARSMGDVMKIARGHSTEPVCPHFASEGDGAVLALPGDPLYPEPSAPPADPTAPTRFILLDGRFVARRA